MLSNLLPGLRDLRAPLAAGFIWLLVFFLYYEEELRDPTGVVASLDSLRRELGLAAQGTALAFIAYLVGSLADTLTSLPFRLRRPREGLDLPFRREQPRAAIPAMLRWYWNRVSRFAAVRPSIRGSRVSPLALDEESSQTLATLIDEAISAPVFVEDRERLPRLLMDDAEQADWLHWVDDAPGPEQRRSALVSYIQDRIMRESDDMRVRLLLDQPALFERVDRLQAEGDFRRAISLPLLVLAVVLLGEMSAAVTAVLIGGTALLFIQGMQRRYQADSALVEALRVGRPISPTLERITAAGHPPKPAIAARASG